MIRLRQVKIKINNDTEEERLKKIANILNIKISDIISYEIHKKSIDARKKDNIYFVYEYDVELKKEDKVKLSKDIIKVTDENYHVPKHRTILLNEKIYIIGSGPAGLFATYLLAEEGYKLVLIERGKSIEERTKDVELFWKTGKLNANSNVQYGEGGAGTFSDGKLNTLVKDNRFIGKKVFQVFVKHGAPKEIFYEQKPHIGTDILKKVIKNMREEIIKRGGEIYYETILNDIEIKDGKLVKIKLNEKWLPCHNLILAIGHSARDTMKMLYEKNIEIKSKPFAVGLRIIHERKMIDQSQYGNFYNLLSPATYKLTHQAKNKRGVYTFCMCPGGYVINASSEEKHLVVNGMSYSKRDSNSSNSAVIVTVNEKDYGPNPLDGLTYQQNLEEKAYMLGKSKIPIQLYKDYKLNQNTLKVENEKLDIMGKYSLANLRKLFNEEINDALIEAIEEFGYKIKGFNNDNVVLAGVESRTSSPIRMIRNENFESNIKGIYPCGEGAGYAGGITTSAMDGIKVAESLIKKYKELK